MADSGNHGINATNGDVLLAPQLVELRRAIDGFDGAPAMQRELSAAADAVAQELEQRAPDKRHILERLSKIDSIAGRAGAIAAATTALAALAEALL
jgi:hypothetical protein